MSDLPGTRMQAPCPSPKSGRSCSCCSLDEASKDTYAAVHGAKHTEDPSVSPGDAGAKRTSDSLPGVMQRSNSTPEERKRLATSSWKLVRHCSAVAIGTPLNKRKMSKKKKKAALQVMPSEDLHVYSGSLEKKVDLCQSFVRNAYLSASCIIHLP